jgi:hypothetical protein
MATKNSFTRLAEGTNRFSRRWGTIASIVEPYITGYHFVRWSYLPTALGANVAYAGKGTNTELGNKDIRNVLESSTLSVTIPGATINKAEFNGLGNIKWAVPTNIEWDNTCTCKYLEASGLPVFSIMHGWVRMIRDYRSGVTTLDSQAGGYNKSTYAATMYYWTTEPNGKWVEYHCCMTGMFPTKDPTDLFGHDITSYDKLEIDIDYNVDYLWHENWTYSKCQEWANEYWGVWNGRDGGAAINGGYSSEDNIANN